MKVSKVIALVFLGLSGVAQAVAFPSGHTWASGAAGAATEEGSGFATWRGSALDTSTTWPARGNWNELSHPDIYGQVSARTEPTLSIALAMWPNSVNGSFAKCKKGTYDSYFRTYGSELVRIGRADAPIRLAWEANLTYHAFSIGSNPAGS